MADKSLQIALVLTAVDKMSRVVDQAITSSSKRLNDFSDKADSLSKKSFGLGRDLTGMAVVAGGALMAPIKAFADLEDSSTALAATMMQDGGKISKSFEPVNKLAIELGDKLPGTTADFNNMFDTLLRGGVSAESLLNGVGKAAAYLSVGIKIPYEDAAKLTAKLKEATGVADKDMLKFMDTIARVNAVGVESGEMQLAFSRSAGMLKALNLQGLDATKSISSVYAMLIKAGASGETVGTGMTSIFAAIYDKSKLTAFQKEAEGVGLQMDFVDKKTGQFKGVENMIAQFQKMQGLNTQQKTDLVTSLLGNGQDAQFALTLINNGVKGFNEMQQRLAGQGTLDAKVEMKLKTLKNQWDAATGTFQNQLAAFGKLLLPVLITVINKFNGLSMVIKNFLEKHPGMAKFIGMAVIGFAALSAGGAILAFTFGGVTKGIALFSKGLAFGMQTMKIATAIARIFAVGGLRLMGIQANFGKASIAQLRLQVMLKNASVKMATISSKLYAAAMWVVSLKSKAMAAGQYLLTAANAVATAGWYAVRTAVQAVTKAMKANPILAIIMLIVGVAMLLIENWDKVKKFFVGMWEGIKKVFSKAWEWIKASIYKYSGMKFIVENWGKIKTWFSDMWAKIKQVFSNFWEWMKAAMYKYSGIKFIIEGWGKVKTWFHDMWAKVKGVFTGFFDWLKGIPKRMFDAGKNMIKSIWEGIKSFVNKPIQAVKDMVGKIRKMLPFSPAKEGPLMDIHRIRLVETIAEGIKPDAMVNKMKKVASATLVPITAMMQPGAVPVGPGGNGPTPTINNSSSASTGGSVAVNITMNLTMGGAGSGGSIADQIKQALRDSGAEIGKIVKEQLRREDRSKIA